MLRRSDCTAESPSLNFEASQTDLTHVLWTVELYLAVVCCRSRQSRRMLVNPPVTDRFMMDWWCYPTGVIPLCDYNYQLFNISTVCSASQPGYCESSSGGKDAPVKSSINSKIFRTCINLLFGASVSCGSLCIRVCHTFKTIFVL